MLKSQDILAYPGSCIRSVDFVTVPCLGMQLVSMSMHQALHIRLIFHLDDCPSSKLSQKQMAGSDYIWQLLMCGYILSIGRLWGEATIAADNMMMTKADLPTTGCDWCKICLAGCLSLNREDAVDRSRWKKLIKIG